MSDNVLTYAIDTVGGQTNVPKCMISATTAYRHIKEQEEIARRGPVETEKTSMTAEEITKQIKHDIKLGERPSLGEVSEENEGKYDQYKNVEDELEK